MNVNLNLIKKKCNSNQKWNNDKCWCKSKKHHICEKDYIWNPATCSCKNGKYLVSIFDDSVITCDEIIEETKKILQQILMKKEACQTLNVYVLLAFLLITITSSIAVSIYCFLIKYQA